MLDLNLDRLKELRIAKDTVIPVIVTALYERRRLDQSNFSVALREAYAALCSERFNNHVPEDEDVWNILSCTIARQVEFERERLYLLSVLLPSFMQVVATDIELQFFDRIFELPG